jgi:hypothetical protein
MGLVLLKMTILPSLIILCPRKSLCNPLVLLALSVPMFDVAEQTPPISPSSSEIGLPFFQKKKKEY